LLLPVVHVQNKTLIKAVMEPHVRIFLSSKREPSSVKLILRLGFAGIDFGLFRLPADNATTVHCELYIRSFGSISPVTMVSTTTKISTHFPVMPQN